MGLPPKSGSAIAYLNTGDRYARVVGVYEIFPNQTVKAKRGNIVYLKKSDVYRAVSLG